MEIIREWNLILSHHQITQVFMNNAIISYSEINKSKMIFTISAKYDGPGKGLASRACNWYINARYGFRVAMSLEFFSVEGDPPSKFLEFMKTSFSFSWNFTKYSIISIDISDSTRMSSSSTANLANT